MEENIVETVDINQLVGGQIEQLDPSQMSAGKRNKKTTGLWVHFTKESIVDLENPNGQKITKARCTTRKDLFSTTGGGTGYLL